MPKKSFPHCWRRECSTQFAQFVSFGSSSIWSPLASSTSINKLKVMQNAALFNNGRYTTNIPTVTTTNIKTNMRHIHASIVSMHLAIRCNNKILRTPPPHINSYVERLPCLTRRTLAQLRTNKSPFLKSYLHKVDAKSHPSLLCPLCNTHTNDTQNLFNCTHIHTTLVPLDLWTYPVGVSALLVRWTQKLAGGPQAGRSDCTLAGSWEWVNSNNTFLDADFTPMKQILTCLLI